VSRRDSKAWEISNPQLALPNPGTTFHGRDIFAPAAAHASMGVDASQFGKRVIDLEILANPRLESPGTGKLNGQTLYADRFGNLITSLGKFTRSTTNLMKFKPWVGSIPPCSTHPETFQLELQNQRKLPWARTFADISPGECAILVGSSGLLEIVANRQSAANLLNLGADEPITLWFEPANPN
jgi:S-adenosylmethionine hydrolase